VLSQKLGIEEENLLERVKALRDNGVIRRFAAGVNHRKLGFESSLLALRVPEEKIESSAKYLTEYKEVTHCYLRNGEYNLWFVFISLTKERMKSFLGELTKRFGKKNILNLSTKKQFKLNTNLKI
jgi:DNA-binding Lrp family transcriptional regulator